MLNKTLIKLIHNFYFMSFRYHFGVNRSSFRAVDSLRFFRNVCEIVKELWEKLLAPYYVQNNYSESSNTLTTAADQLLFMSQIIFSSDTQQVGNRFKTYNLQIIPCTI